MINGSAVYASYFDFLGSEGVRAWCMILRIMDKGRILRIICCFRKKYKAMN